MRSLCLERKLSHIQDCPGNRSTVSYGKSWSFRVLSFSPQPLPALQINTLDNLDWWGNVTCQTDVLLPVEGEGCAISSTCIIFWSVVQAGTVQKIQSQAQKPKLCDCVSMHGSDWHCILKLSCWSLINQYNLCSLCCLKFNSTSTVLTHSDTSLMTIHKSIWRVSASGWVYPLSSGIWKCSVSVYPLISNYCLYFLNCGK